MEERGLRSRGRWIVGMVLAAAFVGTIAWSVAQDSDDAGEEVRFDEVGEAISPGITVPLETPDTIDSFPDGMYRLTVEEDGCGVVRSELPADAPDLQWVFTDPDGQVVFGASALAQDRLRYFEPGEYAVVLEAAGEDGFEEVSNTVTISC